jgi:hypothetical protein
MQSMGRTQNDEQMVAWGARILRCQRLPNQVVGWTGLDTVDDLNELGYIWFGTSPLFSPLSFRQSSVGMNEVSSQICIS